MMFSQIRGWYWIVRQTGWRRFFEYNNRKAWTYTRFMGWTVAQNDLDLHAQYIGIADDGQHFYCADVIRDEVYKKRSRYTMLAIVKNDKEARLKERLDLFLDPKCRCRLGLHYKCEIHGTWRS